MARKVLIILLAIVGVLALVQAGAFLYLRSSAASATDGALAAVLAWDRRMDADRAEPLIYEMYQQLLIRETLGDEISAAGGEELAHDFLAGFRNSSTQTLERLAGEPDSPWWDDVRTAQVESQTEIVTRAFTLAVEQLQTTQGDDPQRWRWGDMHWSNFDHLVFAAVSPLDAIFNRNIPAQGSSFSVNAAGASYEDFVMNSGASFRQIIDLSNLSAAPSSSTPPGRAATSSAHTTPTWSSRGRTWHISRCASSGRTWSAATKQTLLLQPAE